MDSFDIREYKNSFINTTKEDLERIKKLLNENPDEITVIHRLFHTIKGRSFFMGYHDLGVLCLDAEKSIEEKVKMGIKIDENEKKFLLSSIDNINVLMEKI